MSPSAHKELLRLLERHSLGRLPLKQMLKEYNRILGKAYHTAIESRLLDKVFTRDFQGFRDPELAQQYQRHLSKKGKCAADPAAWAKRQSKGMPRLLLERALGDDFVEVINRGLRQGTIPRAVTEMDMRKYQLLKEKITDYDSLKSLARKQGGVGEHFEIDHLLEQRFWRNNPDIESAFDEAGEGLACVVPKDEQVAAEIARKFGREEIRYIHSSKTRMLKDLIPHESEAFFTAQEVWDAHAHVLKSLGAEEVLQVMIDDFRLLAKELGQPLKIRKPTRAVLERWPKVYRNPQNPNEWIIIRKRFLLR